MTDVGLVVRQTLRLKGRGTADAITAASLLHADQVAAVLSAMVETEEAVEASGRFRMTPAGRKALDQLLADERAGIDQAALEVLYEEFDEYNTELKSVASAWQMRGEVPNDHNDASYDSEVLSRLHGLHRRFGPHVDRVAGVVPRLGSYGQRFSSAMEMVNSGDHSYFLKPVIDSYHTIWFEFHEELIGLLGRSRQEEAAAGRAD